MKETDQEHTVFSVLQVHAGFQPNCYSNPKANLTVMHKTHSAYS